MEYFSWYIVLRFKNARKTQYFEQRVLKYSVIENNFQHFAHFLTLKKKELIEGKDKLRIGFLF